MYINQLVNNGKDKDEIFKECVEENNLMKKKSFEPVPLLMSQDGKAIDTSTEMTRTLNKIFGKKIGSSLLRNIFLTDKYKDTKEEMEEDVKAMGTSSMTANTNYIKTE